MQKRTALKKALKAPKLPKTELTDGLPDKTLYEKTYYAQLLLNKNNLAGQIARKVSFDQVIFHQVQMTNTRFENIQILDSRLTGCDLANAEWPEANIYRVEIIGCHLTGFRNGESHWQDVLFKDCGGNFAQFPLNTYKNVRFEECDLSEANFMEADLQGAVFVRCNLHEADFTGAQLQGVDLRSSRLDGARIGPQELRGAIISPEQALALVKSMGITVRAQEEME